jgi:Tol biopolymer transport system component
MSPEQVQGSGADHRADLWALGVVLYEMVIGLLPFKSEYEQALFYSILNEQPEPMTALRSGLPMELERIVGKCLVKNPEGRYQSTTELLVDLTALKRRVEQDSSRVARSVVATGPGVTGQWGEAAPVGPGSAGGAATSSGRRPRAFPLRTPIAALAAVVLAAAAGFWLGRSREPVAGWNPANSQLTRITLNQGVSTQPAISPDGSLIAYTSDQAGNGDLDIWVQQVTGGGAVRLTSNPASDYDPAFSPDGGRIAFRSNRDGGGIYVMPTLGGDERLIAERGYQPRYSPDGREIAYWTGPRNYAGPSRMFLVAANGGAPRRIRADFVSASCAVWLPDGEHLLFRGRQRGDPFDWWVASRDGKTLVSTGARDALGTAFQYLTCADQFDARSSDIVYAFQAGSDARNIWRLRLSLPDFKVQGPPRRVTFGSGFEAYPALAADGRMAFFSASLRYNIWRLPVDHGSGAASSDLAPLTTSLSYDITPQVSADGTYLTYAAVRPGEHSIWLRNLRNGEARVIANGPNPDLSPVLNRDGVLLAYSARQAPTAGSSLNPRNRFSEVVRSPSQESAQAASRRERAIYVVETRGGDLAKQVCQPCGVARDWFSDNRRLLVQVFRGRPAIEVLDIETQKSYRVLSAEDAGVHLARLSPDERWIAFTHRLDADRSRIMIAPFQDGQATPQSAWFAVTEGNAVDDRATWAPDGRRLYFTSDRSGFTGIYTRALDPATKQPRGAVQVVRDFQQITRSMGDMDANDVSLAVADDALLFPLAEVSGNIWLLHPRVEPEAAE